MEKSNWRYVRDPHVSQPISVGESLPLPDEGVKNPYVEINTGYATKEQVDDVAQGLELARREIRRAQVDLERIREDNKKAINEVADQRKSEIEQLRGNLEKDRFKSIEIITLVVAFFTFISTNFQLMSHLTNFIQFVALAFILLGAVTLFVLLTGRIANGPEKWSGCKNFVLNNKLLFISLGFVGVGVFFSFYYADYEAAQKSLSNVKAQNCSEIITELRKEQKQDKIGILRDTYEFIGCNN